MLNITTAPFIGPPSPDAILVLELTAWSNAVYLFNHFVGEWISNAKVDLESLGSYEIDDSRMIPDVTMASYNAAQRQVFPNSVIRLIELDGIVRKEDYNDSTNEDIYA